MPLTTEPIFRRRQQVPSTVHFDLVPPDLHVRRPFVPCSPYLCISPPPFTHAHLLFLSSSRTQNSLSGPSHVTIGYKSSVGSPHIQPATCVHGLRSPPSTTTLATMRQGWPPCAKVLRKDTPGVGSHCAALADAYNMATSTLLQEIQSIGHQLLVPRCCPTLTLSSCLLRACHTVQTTKQSNAHGVTPSSTDWCPFCVLL